VANRPPITAAIDLTSDVLNALKAAGPNERGNYSLDMAVWENTRKTFVRQGARIYWHCQSERPKGRSKSATPRVWVNESIGGGDDLF
jgi:hypothetical protein